MAKKREYTERIIMQMTRPNKKGVSYMKMELISPSFTKEFTGILREKKEKKEKISPFADVESKTPKKNVRKRKKR